MNAGENEEKLRQFSRSLRELQRDWADAVRQGIEADVAKMEAEHFDPARGRGRGPKWADGA